MLQYIHVFRWDLPTYSLCAVLGALAFCALALLRSKSFAVNREDVFYLILLGLVGAMLGSKVLYWITILPWIIQNIHQICSNMALLKAVLTQGYVFYGGLIGGVALCFWYLRRYRLSSGQYIDAIVPGIALFHVFGRIGCFLAGCCYGVAWKHGIVYYAPEHPMCGVPLLPVQLIEAGCNVLLTIGLCWFSRRYRRSGMTLAAYCLSYGIVRFFLEFFRGDAERGFLWIFSTSQWISLALIMASVIGFLRWRKIKHEPSRKNKG